MFRKKIDINEPHDESRVHNHIDGGGVEKSKEMPKSRSERFEADVSDQN